MKFKFNLFLLLAIVLIPFSVKAQTINVSNETLLKAYLSTGGDLKLTSNITLTSNIDVNVDSVIDLNGYTINTGNYSIISYAALNVKDTSDDSNGKITGTSNYIIKVGSSSAKGSLILDSGNIDCSAKSYCVQVYSKGSLTLNDGKISAVDFPLVVTGEVIINGGIVEANKGVIYGNTNALITLNDGLIKTLTDYEAVLLSKPGSKYIQNGGRVEALYEYGHKGVAIGAFKDTEVIINDGEVLGSSAAIMGNGSVSGKNEGTNAKFTINGGSVISTLGLGIYAPQPNGKTLITGGTISGKSSAVEIRAGELTITGGVLNGNKDSYSIDPNDNGSNVIGSAVAIVQHTTKLPITVNISGGTFNSYIPLTESNPMNNSDEDISKITINISDGLFSSSGNKSVDLEDFGSGVVTGGTFSHNVTEYINENTHGERNNDDSTVTVLPYKKINLDDEQYNDVLNVSKLLPGQTGIINIPNTEDYLITVKLTDFSGNEIQINNNKFVMPNSDINVFVNYKFLYKFLAGENQTYKNNNIVIKTNGDISKLIRVDVNDKELDKSNYTLKSGSTILSLDKKYLSSLQNGTYNLKLVYTDGELETTFVVNNSKNSNPSTNDNIVLYFSEFIISFVLLSGLLFIKKITR